MKALEEREKHLAGSNSFIKFFFLNYLINLILDQLFKIILIVATNNIKQ